MVHKMNEIRVSLRVLVLISFLLVSCTAGVVYLARGTSSPISGNTDVYAYAPMHESDYIVGTYNGTHYYAQNGTTGNWDLIDSNKTYVETYAANCLATTGGVIWLRGVSWNSSIVMADDITVLENNGGWKYYNNQGEFYAPQLNGNPSNLTLSNAGKIWYDISLGKMKLWDGTNLQILPSIVDAVNGSFVMSYDWTISESSGRYYAQDYQGNTRSNATDGIIALQYAVDQLPMSGGVILVHTEFNGTGGWLNITKNNVAIITNTNQATDIGTGTTLPNPSISRVTINATSASVKGTYLEGLNMRQLDIVANGQVVAFSAIERCSIVPSSATTPDYKGIVFAGSGTYGYIDYIRVIDCAIQDYYDQATNKQGAITVTDTSQSGTGQFWFVNLDYHPHTANATMFVVDTGARLDQEVWFQHMSFASLVNGTTPFYLKADGKMTDLRVSDSVFEFHYPLSIFSIDAGTGTQAMRLVADFDNNRVGCGNDIPLTTADYNFTWNRAVAADWTTYIASYIQGVGNHVGTLGWVTNSTFSAGLLGECANFEFKVVYELTQGGTVRTWYGNNNPSWMYGYTIYKSTGVFYAINSSTGTADFSNTSALEVLQNCVDAAPYSGEAILVRPDFNAVNGTLNITKSFVSITTGISLANDRNTGDVLYTPCIPDININATDDHIKSIYVQGFNIRQITFNSTGHAIAFVTFEECSITPTNQITPDYKGIVFAGDSVGFTDYVRFIDCSIQDYYNQTTNGQGAITVTSPSSQGTGQIWFTNLDYHVHVDNTTLYVVDTGARTDQRVWFESLSYTSQHAGATLAHLKPNGKMTSVSFTSSTFVFGNETSLFVIDAGSASNSLRMQVEFNHNIVVCGSSSGTNAFNFTLNNAVAADWTNYTGSYIEGSDNHITTLGGGTPNSTFSPGLLGSCANFQFRVGYEVVDDGKTRYYTEHTWILTGVNDGDTIPHYIVDTPTGLTVTSLNDTTTIICGAYNLNSTMFQVRLRSIADAPQTNQTISITAVYDP